MNKENRNLLLLMGGKLVSLFGSNIYTFAIGLYILKITGSGVGFAINLVLSIIPLIFINPIAGVFTDRINKKNIIVSMDFLCGILMLLLLVYGSIWGLSVAALYFVTFFMNIFSNFFSITVEASKPNVVSSKKLLKLNSISKIIDSSAMILGPAIGGVIYGFVDIKIFILINGISFISSAISECFIDFEYNKSDYIISKDDSVKDSFIEGFSYLKNNPKLFKIFSTFSGISFFLGLGVMVPIPFIINNIFQYPAKSLGIIQSGLPLGMIIGAIVIKKIISKISFELIIFRGCIVLSIVLMLISIPIFTGGSEGLITLYYFLMMGILGSTVSVIDIRLMYTVQTIVDEAFRGRVLSLGIGLAKIVSPIAFILSGIVLNKGYGEYISIFSGIGLLIFNIFISSISRSELRSVDKRIGFDR
ncbi:MAG: MFS transporter [Firmicutes bacterium]|jgi:MFS family permease|nr:MFS transporter [Bacillota bacterium]